MNYGELIQQSFWIAWRNRYLWVFGFFAGGGGGLNAPTNVGDLSSGDGEDIGQFFAENLELVITLGAVLLLLILAFLVMSLISQGALAESVAALDRGEPRRFGLDFRAGLASFWRVLLFSLLALVIALGLLLLIGGPVALGIYGVIAGTESLGARVGVIVLLALVGIVALIAVFIPFAIVTQLGLRELIIRRERVVEALRAGYRLFRGRLGTTLLVALLQWGLALAAGLVLVLAGVVLALVLVVPVVVLATSGYTAAAVVAGVFAGLLFFVPLAVASGAVGTFNHAMWTIAYLRLRMPAVPSGMAAPPPALP
jgi:hypothetical protein